MAGSGSCHRYGRACPGRRRSLFGLSIAREQRFGQLSGNLSVIIPSAVFSGMGLTTTKRPISGGNGGNAGSGQPVPAEYRFYDASPDLKLGLAVTAPFGLGTQ